MGDVGCVEGTGTSHREVFVSRSMRIVWTPASLDLLGLGNRGLPSLLGDSSVAWGRAQAL